MNGNTHTIKRLITGLVLATALAALAIPSALAGSNSRYGPLDPWALKYFASYATTTTAVIDGRSPDTQDAAQTAQANLLTPVDGRAPDTIDAATQAHIPVVTVIQQPGFQWGDFGIGVAAALGLTCLLAVAIRLLTAHRSRKQPGSVATA
jgi:hypothetical protein